MKKFRLKGCPRCHGDLLSEPVVWNVRGVIMERVCLQCGYRENPRIDYTKVRRRVGYDRDRYHRRKLRL